MPRWTDKMRFFPLAGRFGDTVDFANLESEFQTAEIAALVGAIAETGTEVREYGNPSCVGARCGRGGGCVLSSGGVGLFKIEQATAIDEWGGLLKVKPLTYVSTFSAGLCDVRIAQRG
jgi:hypothetical protein